MPEIVLAVCAHADDEAFGIAGALARHSAGGDQVHLLFLADGVTARDRVHDFQARRPEIEARKRMAATAAGILRANPPLFLDLPDNRLDALPLLDIIKPIEVVIERIRPTIVYTNHANDLNVDHRLAHQALLTACRPQPDHPVRAIYAFETLSSTEWEPAGLGRSFQPTRFVDIMGHTDTKLAVIRAYELEMRSFPHPRSPEAVEALWKLRGSQVGVAAAEALVVVREKA
jgi:LmbE family N-acetylglucosaminyl deacetylase